MRRLSIFLGTLLLAVPLMRGQQKLEPPARDAVTPDSSAVTREEPLPRIDLPEFQITGKERISLPEFSKGTAEEGSGLDPLLGPRGPGTRNAPALDFGARPKEALGFDTLPGGFNGRVTAGYGSFDTPWFEGWFGRTTVEGDFLLKAGYTSSGGHVPHADFRKGHGEVSAGWNLPGDADLFPGGRLDAVIGMHGDGYRLYGSGVPERKRTVNRFRTDLSLQAALADLFEYTAAFHLQGVGMTDSIRARSAAVGVDLAGERQEGDLRLKALAGFWVDFYDAPSAAGNPSLVHLGAAGTYSLQEDLDVQGGLAVYFFRGSDGDARTRLAPTIGASWYPAGGVRLFARLESSVERNSLGRLAERNPYIVNDPVIRHGEKVLIVAAGAEVDLRLGLQASLAMEYTRERSAPVYLDDVDSGLWRPDYTGLTRTLALRAGVRGEIADRHTLSLSLVLQGARNSALDATPPYVPAGTLAAFYQYRFPVGLTVGGSVRLVSERPVDGGNIRVLSGFGLVDLSATYAIVGGLSLTGTLTNILNPSCFWWEGYRAPPRGVGVSLSHSW